MQFVVVGANHRSAPVELRERLGVAVDAPAGFAAALQSSAAEVLALSTCNRVEVYAVCGHEQSGVERLRRMLAGRSGIPIDAVREATYAHGHRAAVRHLLCVASGLDSAVVGEREILVQVRRAVDACREAGSLGPVLERLAGSALACGRRVRWMTGLGAQGRSVASEAVNRATLALGGSLAAKTVAVLGAGEVAASVLALLSATGARVSVFNRTHAAGRALAAVHGAESLPWDDRLHAAAHADLIVVCTASHEHVLTTDALTHRRVGAGPLVCVDLGVPRGVEPAVGDVPGVTLIGIDDLGAGSADAAGLATAVRTADMLVDSETDRFLTWWQNRSVSPTIARLRAHADRIAQAEVERALVRLGHLSPRDREVVRDVSFRVLAKWLHAPMRVLREDAEGANAAAMLSRLFELGDPQQTSRADAADDPHSADAMNASEIAALEPNARSS